MYLLILIVLTGPGTMAPPVVLQMDSESECVEALPVAIQVAAPRPFVAVCVRVESGGV